MSIAIIKNPIVLNEIKKLYLTRKQWHIVEDSLDMFGGSLVKQIIDDGDVDPSDIVETLNRVNQKVEEVSPDLNNLLPITLIGMECLVVRVCLTNSVFFKHKLDEFMEGSFPYRRAANNLEQQLAVVIPR